MNEKALVRVTRATSARTASFPMWQGASRLSASSNRIERCRQARGRGPRSRPLGTHLPAGALERWSVELLEHRSAANDARVRSVGHFSNGCSIVFPHLQSVQAAPHYLRRRSGRCASRRSRAEWRCGSFTIRTTRAVSVPPPLTPARDFIHSLGLPVRAISGVPDRRLDLAPSPRHADERSDRQVLWPRTASS